MKSDINTELMRLDTAYRDAYEFYVATHPIPVPPVASGESLDKLGELFALTRNSGKTDDDFRSRIRLELAQLM